MRTNYVLIDYENVQPSSIKALEAEHFKVLLFVGEKQKKICIDVVNGMHGMGARAQYVQISGNGSNALDFHIAYYIGALAAKEPNACFHIISKDTGFDPLITHLQKKKLSVYRAKNIAGIRTLKATISKNSDERLEKVITRLEQLKNSKPSKLTGLSKTINTWFQGALTDHELKSLRKGLEKRAIIQVKENKVLYPSQTKSLPQKDTENIKP